MWRLMIVFTLCLLIAACSPTGATPANEAVQPQQVEAVDSATADMAAQLNLDLEAIQVIKVEDAEWSDSCLGLGGPAESCALVIVPGYRITLEADGVQYVYRTDESGSTLRLEQIAE